MRDIPGRDGCAQRRNRSAGFIEHSGVLLALLDPNRQFSQLCTPDGGLQGYLAGYTPVEKMYDLQFGARHSKNAKGELAPLPQRLNTSMGRAGALGNSCTGSYAALYEAADGDRDPKTGRCTSISTQYKVKLAPAFVIDARTQSVNSSLTLR